MTIPKYNLKKNIIICMVFSLLQLWIVFISPTLYLQLLLFTLSSIYYGIAEPKKGWILGIVQSIIITSGYFLIRLFGIEAIKPQEATYTALMVVFPSFIVSYLSSRLFASR